MDSSCKSNTSFPFLLSLALLHRIFLFRRQVSIFTTSNYTDINGSTILDHRHLRLICIYEALKRCHRCFRLLPDIRWIALAGVLKRSVVFSCNLLMFSNSNVCNERKPVYKQFNLMEDKYNLVSDIKNMTFVYIIRSYLNKYYFK